MKNTFTHLLIFCFIIIIFSPQAALRAQSTGDSLDVVTLTPIATAPPVLGWEGQIVAENGGIGMESARLIVRIPGGANQKVRLSTLSQILTDGVTGQKLELGDNAVEFAGLTPGRYIIEPRTVRARFDVDLKSNVETIVEFREVLPTPTTTPTASTTPTNTPRPVIIVQPTDTPPPPTDTATPAPLPSPTPLTRWLGLVERRQFQADEPASILVRAFGLEGLPLQLKRRTLTGGIINEQRCRTGQQNSIGDACEFADVLPGSYIIDAEQLEVSLPVTVSAHEQLTVLFDIEVLPVGVVGWQAAIRTNSNTVQPTNQTDSVITARVEGRQGQMIRLRSAARNIERTCEVVRSPLQGLACEFTTLPAGVYTVEAVNTEAALNLFVDGQGRTEVLFAPNARDLPIPQPAMFGYGVRPNQPTATPTQPPTATATPRPTRVYIPPTFTPTPTVTPTITPTATPAFAWQGRIVEVKNGIAGTIGVRAAGLKDHPVVIQSGDWQSPPALTGIKPELGQYGVEFAGMAQGQYTVSLVGLADFSFRLQADQYVLVEFRYDFVEGNQ